MSDAGITALSPTPDGARLLIYGPLVLDLDSRILTGFSISADVRASEFAILQTLMQPAVVSVSELLAVAFPLGKRQPRWPERALATRMLRVRMLLESVGVSRGAIRCWSGQGYGLGLSGVPVRTYVGKEIRLLDALLASHPDRAGVEALVSSFQRYALV